MMSYKFSKLSTARLNTVHPSLRRVIRTALADPRCPSDFAVLCGERSREAQEEACRKGFSKVRFPKSKHNRRDCDVHGVRAVDIAPYPIDWNDLERFKALAQHVLTIGNEMNVVVRWGGDWDMDGETADERFIDMPHFELAIDPYRGG